MSFLTELEVATNKTAYTSNGAISNQSTLNPVLDFFASAGVMRTRTDEAISLFKKAYASDPTNAMRTLFYLRDIRGGQGERAVFRAILNSLDEETLNKVSKFIPVYGRWDEVPFNSKTVPELLEQLEADEAAMKKGKPVSLLAKWLPSENTSSKRSRDAATKLATEWGITPRNYRKRVAALRKHIQLLEHKMSAKEWAEIQYDKLPTQAHRKHIQAFKRNDLGRYEAYLGAVEKGEKKINANTAFTYEVYDMLEQGEERTANAMWNALPDYTRGENALVLPDVSGSMYGRPISIAVSLALYFAEHNKGTFKDCFLEFSSKAVLRKVTGNSFSDRLYSVQNSTNWMGSTNLQSAFDAILDAAKASNATAEDMPKVLYIISDMQFNQATSSNKETNFETAQRKFKEAGYEMPHVVFWNCSEYGDSKAPATMYDNKVTLISGASQSTFQYAVAGKTPMESMLEVLNSERYAQITV